MFGQLRAQAHDFMIGDSVEGFSVDSTEDSSEDQ
jgi:hypothetical protein